MAGADSAEGGDVTETREEWESRHHCAQTDFQEEAWALVQERAERIEKLEKALQLETHKVITCGVAAHHPDPTLTRTKKCYAEDWNSPQAEDVRKLRENRDALRKLVEDIDKSGLLGHHPTTDSPSLQQRINEALEDKP